MDNLLAKPGGSTYEKWLRAAWSKARLAAIVEPRGRQRGRSLYSRVELDELVQKYSKLSGSTAASRESLRTALDTILTPYIPKSPNGVGVYLREWPLPCGVSQPAIAPEERGDAVVPSNIMSGAVERVIAKPTLYRTMHDALSAASRVSRHFGMHTHSSLESFARGAVVGDLVKVQALYADIGGKRFTADLGKRSCHTLGMYQFAGRLLPDELELLGVEFVVAFASQVFWGPAREALAECGWITYRPVDGTGKPLPSREAFLPPRKSGKRGPTFILLPHPQARGNALEKGVEAVLRDPPF
jgi:hypothetical protein